MSNYLSILKYFKICCILILPSIYFVSCENFKSHYSGNLFLLQDSDTKLYYYSDTNFKQISTYFQTAYDFIGNYCLVYNDLKYSILDRNFELILEEKNSIVKLYKDFAIVLSKNDSIKYINLNSKKEFEFLGAACEVWRDKFVIIRGKNSKYSVFSISTNKIIIDNLESVRAKKDNIYDSEYLVVRRKNKEGLIDSLANFILPIEYDCIFPIVNDVIPFIKDNKLGLFDKYFNLLINPEFDRIDDLAVKELKFNNFSNITLNRMLSNYGIESGFKNSNHYHFLKQNNQNFIFDSKTNKKFKIQHNVISKFNENIAIAERNGKYYYIDSIGKNLNNATYSNCQPIVNGFGFIRKNNLWGVLDKNGKKIVDFIFDDFKFGRGFEAFGNGFAIVSKAGKYGVINIKGEEILPCKYLDIEEIENFKIFIAKVGNSINERKNLVYGYNGKLVMRDTVECLGGRNYLELKVKNKIKLYNIKMYMINEYVADKITFISEKILKIEKNGIFKYEKIK